MEKPPSVSEQLLAWQSCEQLDEVSAPLQMPSPQYWVDVQLPKPEHWPLQICVPE